MLRFFFRIISLGSLVLILSAASSLASTKILVFAAASLSNVLPEISREFEKQCGCQIVMSFAGSGTLARQIVAGAPADIFISANQQWFEQLLEGGQLANEHWKSITSNQLVIAGGGDQKEISAAQLEDILGAARFAMGDILSVPAGIYAQQALEKMGFWQFVRNNAIYGENVRISLKMAARGDVRTAIVYASDVLLEPKIQVLYRFPAGLHDKIDYPAGLVTKRDGEINPATPKFLEYLTGSKAASIFLRHGFGGCQDVIIDEIDCSESVGQ